MRSTRAIAQRAQLARIIAALAARQQWRIAAYQISVAHGVNRHGSIAKQRKKQQQHRRIGMKSWRNVASKLRW